MVKMEMEQSVTDYLITGIWFEENGNSKFVSHVQLHDFIDETVKAGKKITKEKIIELIDANKEIYTATWNYAKSVWERGSKIYYEVMNDTKFLRSGRDKDHDNNLDNLIVMS